MGKKRDFKNYCGGEDRDNCTDNVENHRDVKIDPTAGANRNKCKYVNLDINGGFQDIDPMMITLIAEIIGNILSGKLPANVANAFGNWLQLIAQIIAMYNAQQQYFQSGPGRYYNLDYKNVSNPFCSSYAESDKGDLRANIINRKRKNNKNNGEINQNDIHQIKDEVVELKNENELLRKEIDEIKKQLNLLKK